MMRILQYNIWNGCQGDPVRLAHLGVWLKQQAYDVVGLNELNGWDQAPGMSKHGQDWDYPYAELFVTKRSRHFVGVLSKYPIQVIETREVHFHHGMLHVCIRDIHYIITHLTPVDATDREGETTILAEMARSISGSLVLMGDMNTLSPLDQDQHEATGLVEVLRCDPVLQRKFLTGDMIINYRPMQLLLDARLTDLGAMVKADYSVPTTANKDKAHAVRMRLDYILANNAFGDRSSKTQILHNAQVHVLSDHYPVECTWDE